MIVGTNTVDEPRPAIVRFVAVCKSFGDHRVLRDITFDIPAGQRIVLIGPSGSGKTTILRCLMTLESINSGTIEVAGRIIDPTSGRPGRSAAKRLREVRRGVGMVFQQFNLFPHMRVIDNVTIAPQKALGLTRAECLERGRELLGLVGLSDKTNAFPHELSGGQQQRVAIARALALKPEVMLFDEVTSALDPELVGEVLKVIRKLATESGMTMLIVTHEMAFAAEIADRVLFLEDGLIVEDDAPGAIFTNPAEERTRQFLRALSDR